MATNFFLSSARNRAQPSRTLSWAAMSGSRQSRRHPSPTAWFTRRGTTRWGVAVALFAATSLTAACGSPTGTGPPPGVQACGVEPIFTVSPLPLGDVAFLNPIGTTGLVFQKHHLGVHIALGHPTAVPVVAPGEMHVVEVSRVRFNEPSGREWSDYALRFYPCADVSMHWAHLSSLAPEVEARLGPWSPATCREPYVAGQTIVTTCQQRLTFRLTAGTPVGMLGGPGMPTGLDWGAYDRRGPPLPFLEPGWYGGNGNVWSGNFVACPIEYFAEPLRSTLMGRFGDGHVTVNAAPVCGRTMWDVAGRARGRWFSGNTMDEARHLSLVPDAVHRDLGVFNVGSTVPNLPAGFYRMTSPMVSDGRVNRNLEQVTSDGQIYCYELLSQMAQPTLAFIQLVAPDRIRIDGRPGESCGDPAGWAFSASAAEFRRRLTG